MRSISGGLTRNLLLAAGAIAGTGLAGLALAAIETCYEQFDLAIDAKALAIAELARPAPGGYRVVFTERFLRSFDGRHARDYFEIWDRRGAVLARSNSLGASDLRPGTFPAGRRPRHRNTDLPSGRPGRIAEISFVPDGATEPLLLAVASDREELEESITQITALAVGCGAVLAVAFAIAIPKLTRRGLRPLTELGEAVARVDPRSLEASFRMKEAPAELAPIAERLDQMLARIRESVERERRFSADLAHELRTPVAEIRSLAECALKWPKDRDPETDSAVLESALQLESMVSQLLLLARSEGGRIGAMAEPTPLAPLLRASWSRFERRASERRLAPEIEVGEEHAPAAAALLRAVVDNLVENAVEYAPEGGRVRICLGAEAGRARILIENEAGALDPADLERMFDRFWRKEGARSGGRHVGLGLPVSRSLAEAMGWSVEARMPRPGWLSISLTGPA